MLVVIETPLRLFWQSVKQSLVYLISDNIPTLYYCASTVGLLTNSLTGTVTLIVLTMIIMLDQAPVNDGNDFCLFLSSVILLLWFGFYHLTQANQQQSYDSVPSACQPKWHLSQRTNNNNQPLWLKCCHVLDTWDIAWMILFLCLSVIIWISFVLPPLHPSY